MPEERPDFDTICKALTRIYKLVDPPQPKVERRSSTDSSAAQAAAAPREKPQQPRSPSAKPFASPRLPTSDEVALVRHCSCTLAYHRLSLSLSLSLSLCLSLPLSVCLSLSLSLSVSVSLSLSL